MITIVVSRNRSGVDVDERPEILKNSALATLFALDNGGRNLAGGVGQLGDMSDRADTLVGRLNGKELTVMRTGVV